MSTGFMPNVPNGNGNRPMNPINVDVTPVPEQTPMTDSEYAGNVAAAALHAGRVRLGAAFARIALEALTHEEGRRQLPHVEPYTPHFDEVAQRAQVETFGDQQPATPPFHVPDHGRCQVRTDNGEGPDGTCHRVAVYNPGDPVNRIDAGWYHLDRQWDTDHTPFV